MTENREIVDWHDAAIWDAFVNSQINGTCYHLYGWRRAFEKGLGYETRYLAETLDGAIVGVLPIAFVSSRIFGKSVVSLPFCSYGGAIGISDDVIKRLNKYASQFALSVQSKYFETRIVERAVLSAEDKSLYVTFRKEIPEGPPDLSFIPSKRRNMVRKGVSAGLNAMVKDDLDSFYELYFENARTHGTPALPKIFFVELRLGLGNAMDILFVSTAEGCPISCIMSFYSRGSVHAGFAGEASIARATGANDFKYWSLYVHAKERACTVFDLGRSKVGTGSFEFKRLWGLVPSPIVHVQELFSVHEAPKNNPTNPKFALAIKIWPKLPKLLTRWLGPKIIDGLG